MKGSRRAISLNPHPNPLLAGEGVSRRVCERSIGDEGSRAAGLARREHRQLTSHMTAAWTFARGCGDTMWRTSSFRRYGPWLR